ncbi:MAG TPA: DoxX family protein [Membranihabitans sp.]|nr:DoxX family protein [Membranihabitans sp.]
MKSLLKVSSASTPVDLGILVGRIGVSVLMFTHGIPKIGRLFQDEVKFLDFMGLGPEVSLILAILAEVLCSVLVILGLATRFAVIPLIITMLIALIMVHGADPFAVQEKLLLYILFYVVLFITGSGRFSLDEKLFNLKA